MVTLLYGMLDKATEAHFLNYIMGNPKGILFIYDKQIVRLPDKFNSLQTSRYLAALECLSGYQSAPEHLRFAVEWLLLHETEDGWDLGAPSKDGIYLPLSDSWRKPEDRRKDCTERINKLLGNLLK